MEKHSKDCLRDTLAKLQAMQQKRRYHIGGACSPRCDIFFFIIRRQPSMRKQRQRIPNGAWLISRRVGRQPSMKQPARAMNGSAQPQQRQPSMRKQRQRIPNGAWLVYVYQRQGNLFTPRLAFLFRRVGRQPSMKQPARAMNGSAQPYFNSIATSTSFPTEVTFAQLPQISGIAGGICPISRSIMIGTLYFPRIPVTASY